MSAPRPPVAAIVPAWNEEARIGETVRAVLAVPEIDEVVVVDDGSTDATAAAAEAAGARAFRLGRRRGKGAALSTGVARTRAEVLVFIDADLGPTARIAGDLLRPVLEGEADMVVAAPPPAGPSGFGLVENLARRGISTLTGRSLQRPLSGQRALRRAVLQNRPLAARFGVEVGLTVDALRAGFEVLEVPLALEHRRTGRDAAGFAHRARQGWDVARALLVRAVQRGSAPRVVPRKQ